MISLIILFSPLIFIYIYFFSYCVHRAGLILLVFLFYILIKSPSNSMEEVWKLGLRLFGKTTNCSDIIIYTPPFIYPPPTLFFLFSFLDHFNRGGGGEAVAVMLLTLENHTALLASLKNFARTVFWCLWPTGPWFFIQSLEGHTLMPATCGEDGRGGLWTCSLTHKSGAVAP